MSGLLRRRQKRKAKETEAQKDEGTCPRSPERPVAEPENKSVRIQSWFLGHSVPSGKQFGSLLPPPRLSAKPRTPTSQPCQGVNLSTNKGPPKTCSGPSAIDRDSWTSMLAFWVDVEKLDTGVQNLMLKVTNSERPLGLRMSLSGKRLSPITSPVCIGLGHFTNTEKTILPQHKRGEPQFVLAHELLCACNPFSPDPSTTPAIPVTMQQPD
ncbi:hypothetical protein DUI87_29865 [Hirundo rustica rustica]|uniref:Uncharacterized protein n=1 Tax=Hirundo rustica rustica TaxID=333673 RepID=A0A3M0IYL3_HIRRU|nr:hypothetical protein DUI87_29865 [Hirundo rustica rustica]